METTTAIKSLETVVPLRNVTMRGFLRNASLSEIPSAEPFWPFASSASPRGRRLMISLIILVG